MTTAPVRKDHDWDDRFLAAVNRGEPKAFDELYRRFRTMLYARMRGMCAEDEAIDVVSEAMTEVWEQHFACSSDDRTTRFDSIAKLYAWVKMIAINKARNRNKRRRVRREAAGVMRRAPDLVNGYVADQPRSPDEAAMVEQARGSLALMAPADRALLIFYGVYKLPAKKVAEMLGWAGYAYPAAKVSKEYKKALVRFRRRLEGERTHD